MADFEEGDLVRLKSGSPVLCVSSLDKHGEVEAIWFVEGHPYRVWIPKACLVSVQRHPMAVALDGFGEAHE